MSRESGVPMIATNDLSRSWIARSPKARTAISRVLRSGRFLLDVETAGFEIELAAYIGTKEAIAVASGSDALALAMLGVGVEPEAEVVIAPNAGGYAAIAAAQVGGRVVYADVDAHTACLSIDAVIGAIGPATRAVVLTHLYGNFAQAEALVAALRPRGIALIEDCAQSIGVQRHTTRAGSIGDAAAFSFYPTKNLGGAGDGGAVLTSNSDVAERVRRLRQYGWTDRYRVGVAKGRNSRMDEIQAALLRIGLESLEERNARRVAILNRLRAASGHLHWLTGSVESVAHLAVFRSRDRPLTRHLLGERGVGTDVHYPILDYLQPALPEPARTTPLVVAEALAAEVVTVPCYPELAESEVERIACALGEVS
jgi:dTDP-4-amino-4,6-dideoxygalactose transaminase